jgi:pilus assembly protein FimV
MQAQTFIEQNKMPVLLGILLFLILLWLLKRRNARSELTFEEQMAMQSTATETAEKPTDESETDDNQQEQPTENNDETVAAAAPTSKQKTVDEYIAQADMFVGYADYAQARTSLEKARDIDADNRSVNEKLLFVLYKQQQTDSFNSLITDANIDLNDPVWTEAAEWARELDPHNERYAEQQIDVSSIEQSLDDIEPELNEPLEPTEEAEVEESLQDEPLSTDLEFDLDKFAEELDAEADQFSSDDKTNDLDTLDLSTQLNDSDADDESLDINDVVNLESEQSDELNLDSLDLSDLESELDSPDDVSLELDIAEEAQPDDTDLAELALSLNDEADSEQLDEDLAFDLSVDDADDSLQIDDELTLSDFDINDDSDELTNTDTADNDLDFELEDFDEVDEAETKLDLANAYIEMGDPEGARSILQEVLKDGSSEQKVRAQSALDSIRTA